MIQELLDAFFQQPQTQNFGEATENIQKWISQMGNVVFLKLLKEIGVIPEKIPHDSTEEKLFAKTADIVLCECFQRLGLHAHVLQERANSADVSGSSPFYQYTFVADAKTFRLSRTAKNQKDFKFRLSADGVVTPILPFWFVRTFSILERKAKSTNRRSTQTFVF